MNEKRNFDYKRLHPFKWYILENFPFLEDSIDVLTNYQLFCKLGEMYNKQVNAINTLGVQVEGITDWFDDLDVQEEVNNKLDEMAESGELQDIITQYLQVSGVLGYDTKQAMKQAENLIDGSIARTLGDTNLQDGKGSFYKVREVTNTDVVDNENIIALANDNLVAEKIINNIIKITSNMSSQKIKGLIELEIPKLVVFEKATYTLTSALHIPNNTIIDLNGATLDFDFEGEAIGVYGYKFDDTFTGYDGNSFVIKNGTLNHCSIALLHNINTRIENINFTNATNTNHIIQIGGCKDIIVKGCIFNGTEKVDESSDGYLTHEVINIDPCTYGAQPYAPETSPMYDNTINNGIYIINNTFNKGDDTNTKCYLCVGSHAVLDNYPIFSKNIVIKENKFNYAMYSCMSFIDMDGVKIINNYFNGYGANSTVTFLMARVTNKNIEVINNKVENVWEFYHSGTITADYYQENFEIKNNILNNITANNNTSSCFWIINCKNFLIDNNIASCSGIIALVGDNNTNIAITNNILKSSTTNNHLIKLYGQSSSSGSKIINNVIEGNLTFGGGSYCIVIDGQTDYEIVGNTFNNVFQFIANPSLITKKVHDNTALFPLTDLMSTSNLSSTAINATLENFKGLKVLCGSGQHTQVIDLKPFIHNGQYLDSRTMQAPTVNENNSIGTLSITVDTTNNKISGTSSGVIRRIYAYT